jgi:hypothetical protein
MSSRITGRKKRAASGAVGGHKLVLLYGNLKESWSSDMRVKAQGFPTDPYGPNVTGRSGPVPITIGGSSPPLDLSSAGRRGSVWSLRPRDCPAVVRAGSHWWGPAPASRRGTLHFLSADLRKSGAAGGGDSPGGVECSR